MQITADADFGIVNVQTLSPEIQMAMPDVTVLPILSVPIVPFYNVWHYSRRHVSSLQVFAAALYSNFSITIL